MSDQNSNESSGDLNADFLVWDLISSWHTRVLQLFYLIGFGGGGMTVGVTNDPSNITGIVGKNEVVGNDTDDK